MESEELYVGDKMESVGPLEGLGHQIHRKSKSKIKQRLETRSNVKGRKGSLGFRVWGA